MSKAVLEMEQSRDLFIDIKERANSLNDVFPTCDCLEGREDGPFC